MKALIPLLVALLASPVFGADVDSATAPGEDELRTLLSGNTMRGRWAGRPYTQFFDPNGQTRYKEDARQLELGRWRVNERGQYCSVWPPSDRWVCYNVRVSGNTLYWQSGDDYYPAEVQSGQHL